MKPKKLSDRALRKIYAILRASHREHLQSLGVKLPALKNSRGEPTKDALVLAYLAKDWPNTRPVHKSELTQFVRLYYPDVNDVQQARHLGAQKGWWVVAGGRDNIVRRLGHGEYQLHSLEKPYPKFTAARRGTDGNFERVKAEFHRRCATCGSVEGEPHLHWPGTKTVLQRAHMNPAKPLTADNTIPQCQKCNRADGDKWVYDRKGRVVAVASVRAVLRSDEKVRREIFERLRREFGK